MFLENAVKTPQDFIDGKLILSFADKEYLQQNVIFNQLTNPWEHDELVISILSVILPSILESVKFLFGDFLEGGEWTMVSPYKRQQTLSVPKNNKFSETVFGHVDRILNEKPNISTIAQEASIRFTHNKTLKWLETKNNTDKEKLLCDAQKNVKKTRVKFKERRIEIEERRKQLLREKFQENEERERKRIEKLSSFTSGILDWGLWQSIEQVDQHLKLYTTNKDKVAGLKAQ